MAEEQAKHWDKAEADINKALKLSPDQPELLNYLGYSWVDQNQHIPKRWPCWKRRAQLQAL